MFNWIKRFFTTIYPRLDADKLARLQHEESRKAYLVCLQDAEEAALNAAHHTQAAEMHRERALRLQTYVQGGE